MKTILFLLAGAVLVMTGCASKPDAAAKLREHEAFLKGQQQALGAMQQAQQPVVWFRGLIRNSRVPWTEELTLARALLAAEYTGTLDPISIRVIRQGQTYAIDIKALLRGQDDPPLEPGDIVEVLR